MTIYVIPIFTPWTNIKPVVPHVNIRRENFELDEFSILMKAYLKESTFSISLRIDWFIRSYQ